MIHTIDGIISAACGSRTGVIAVAAAHDQPVIEAVVDARREGIATALWSRILPPMIEWPATPIPTALPRR